MIRRSEGSGILHGIGGHSIAFLADIHPSNRDEIKMGSIFISRVVSK